jgi:mono/diheme cytochrome c family protein
MLHQLAQDRTLGTQPARGGASGGYGVPASRGNEEPPPAVIEPGITIGSIASEGGIAFGQTAPVRQTSLSVDMAVSARSNRVAVVSPGNQLSLFPQVVTGAWHRPTSAQDTGIAEGRILVRSTAASQIDSARVNTPNTLGGQAVAVAFDGRDRVVVQTRAPSRIVVIDGPVMSIGDEVRRDTGQEVFHAMTDSFLACASCHPEGGDDGRVWTFEGIGRRRTPPVRGGIMDTAPFHWDGDMRSFAHLTSEVFTGRMAGNQLTPEQARALEHWIDRVPSVPVARPVDTASVARGEALFRSDEVGCAGCHSGAKFTNNQTVDVGTGSAFQVPTLVGLASRGSLMHDGCATTLRERFTNTRCGGGDAHGHTTQLDAAQLGDLVAYLRTL